MKPLAPILGLALALAGCSQLDQAFAPPPPSALSQPIQAAEIDWSRKSGANTVSGIATMKAGDTTHTCGGQAANLVPDSAYARARMTAIFGNDTRGTRASAQGPALRLDPAPHHLRRLRQLLLPARPRRRLVRHDRREVGRPGRPRRGRLDDEAGGRAGREAGQGDVALDAARRARRIARTDSCFLDTAYPRIFVRFPNLLRRHCFCPLKFETME